GKKNSGNVTHVFPSMLAQPTEDEGAVLEIPSETQPIPSPTHPSEDKSEPQPDPFLRPSSSNPIPDSIPEGSGGNHGGQSSSDRSLSGNKDGLTLQSVYDLCVSLCKQVTTQAAQIKDLKAQIKQLKKKAKPVISHHNAWIKSVSIRKRLAKKKSLKTKLMQKESVSKHRRKPAKSEPTVHKDLAFDDLDDSMDYMETGDAHNEGTVKKQESILTLKPLPKIDPKDKGKKVLEEKDESDAELEGVNEAERKFAQLANDEEITRKVQEEWEAEEEKKSFKKKRVKFTIEERAKLLHDTITAQRRFLAQQRAAKIRSRPPTRTQLRNQMMTDLKHVGGKKHFDLKNKIFEEIQILYEKVKSSDENFVAIGSAEDERIIRELNKKAA
ncbi:hypothetical protein Tco_1388254, partial [Tanacetum coccineum]